MVFALPFAVCRDRVAERTDHPTVKDGAKAKGIIAQVRVERGREGRLVGGGGGQAVGLEVVGGDEGRLVA